MLDKFSGIREGPLLKKGFGLSPKKVALLKKRSI